MASFGANPYTEVADDDGVIKLPIELADDCIGISSQDKVMFRSDRVPVCAQD